MTSGYVLCFFSAKHGPVFDMPTACLSDVSASCLLRLWPYQITSLARSLAKYADGFAEYMQLWPGNGKCKLGYLGRAHDIPSLLFHPNSLPSIPLNASLSIGPCGSIVEISRGMLLTVTGSYFVQDA